MPERIASAKINLALHVTGQRPDGYHELDTLAVFTEFGDRVSVSKISKQGSPPIELKLSGPFAAGLQAGEGNLAFTAAAVLLEEVTRHGIATTPVKIHLEKNLPVASGIGGGSADAAATLLALKDIWKLEAGFDLFRIAGSIGSDVSMCLHSRPLRARGIGDEISFPTDASEYHLVLVNPGFEVSTPEVFSKLMSRENTSIQLPTEKWPVGTQALLSMRNDLYAATCDLFPQIKDVIQKIEATGSQMARMSGSGATCFGLYTSEVEAHRAARLIASDHPEWWCIASRTTSP